MDAKKAYPRFDSAAAFAVRVWCAIRGSGLWRFRIRAPRSLLVLPLDKPWLTCSALNHHDLLVWQP